MKHSPAIYFLVVLIVVVSNIMLAPDWLSGPLSPMPKSKVGTYRIPAIPTHGPNDATLSSVVTTNTLTRNNITPVAQTPSQPSAKDNINIQGQQTPSQSSAINNIDVPVDQTPPQPKCDINACTSAYQSFQESDCTYQPRNGPRRLCTKGIVPREPNGAPNAAASNTDAGVSPQSNAQCNVNVCAAAYRSFDPSDCSYQPSNGPRRLCRK